MSARTPKESLMQISVEVPAWVAGVDPAVAGFTVYWAVTACWVALSTRRDYKRNDPDRLGKVQSLCVIVVAPVLPPALLLLLLTIGIQWLLKKLGGWTLFPESINAGSSTHVPLKMSIEAAIKIINNSSTHKSNFVGFSGPLDSPHYVRLQMTEDELIRLAEAIESYGDAA